MAKLVKLSTPGTLVEDAAASFERTRADLLARAGIRSGTDHPDQASRPYDRQVALFERHYTTDTSQPLRWPRDKRPWRGRPWYRRKGYAAAAIPGTSNHGNGNTVDWQDLGGYGSTSWKKADPILREHGWSNAEGRRVNESWHWTYNKANDQHLHEPGPFEDVPKGHQFAEAIAWMEREGISTGYADGTYRPGEPVSREAVAAFMYRHAGRPAVKLPARSPFKDVKTSDQFYREIVWLDQQGITTGFSDGTFRPKDGVTREAVAAFLYRAAGRPKFDAPARPTFKDVPKGDQFYREVEWLRSQGITTGFSDGTFRPGEDVTREAVAAFLSRFDRKV